MDAIETYRDGNIMVTIVHDLDPMSPRDADNIGKLCLFARSYDLPDEGPGGAEAAQEAAAKADVALPVWGYIHSGIAIKVGARTYPFDCPWDGGQLGVIYANLDDDMVPDDWDAERLEECLRHEVEEFNAYLTGQVYGIVVQNERTGETLDSVWGYIDPDGEYLQQEARAMLSHHAIRPEDLTEYEVLYRDEHGLKAEMFAAEDMKHAIDMATEKGHVVSVDEVAKRLADNVKVYTVTWIHTGGSRLTNSVEADDIVHAIEKIETEGSCDHVVAAYLGG